MQLSVVIVSYNSKTVLKKCLSYLKKRLAESFFSKKDYEIIVVDNNSQDGSKEWLAKQKDLKIILLKENIGFGRGNNVGLQLVRGDYVLFLNSDVYLQEKIDFAELINFLAKSKHAAGLTIKLLLENGSLDWATHRGFPTPWNALCYFTGLEKLFAKTALSNFFGGYHLTHLSLDTTHEVDAVTAAFLLLKRSVIKQVQGFDPDYFFYGEDLDLCYRIKNLGYSLYFYPRFSALHLKYQSGKKSAAIEVRKKSQYYFFSTMLLFYDKHYKSKYPRWLNFLVKIVLKGALFINR